MNKEEFYRRAEDASRQSMDELRYNVRNYAMKLQLGISSDYDLPSSEDFTPTAFYAGYNSGGVHGGSCMSRDYLKSYQGDQKEASQFDSLDTFLEQNFPGISARTIRALEQATVDAAYTKSEWYGNSDDYVVRTLNFDAMVKILQDADLVDKW